MRATRQLSEYNFCCCIRVTVFGPIYRPYEKPDMTKKLRMEANVGNKGKLRMDGNVGNEGCAEDEVTVKNEIKKN